MLRENGGAVDAKKITLATNAAIEACDALDGVKDGVLEEPRALQVRCENARVRSGRVRR